MAVLILKFILQFTVSYVIGLFVFVLLNKNRLPMLGIPATTSLENNHFWFQEGNNSVSRRVDIVPREETLLSDSYVTQRITTATTIVNESENYTAATPAIDNQTEPAFIPFNYFTNQVSISTLLRRQNIVNVHMGCHIAKWVYEGYISKYRAFNDCYYALQKNPHRELTNASQLQPGDTIYVPIIKLEHFVNHTLPFLSTPVVVFSGLENKAPQFPRYVFKGMIQNEFIKGWFLQNLPQYANFKTRWNGRPPKLHSWPYGIHFLAHRNLLMELLQEEKERNYRFIYAAYVSQKNNRRKRHKLFSTMEPKTQNQSMYYSYIHQSRYVFSPDGDRPECFRHYEAIALGTKPITQLTPASDFKHLGDNVIYDNQEWNVTTLQQQLPPVPKVNPRLVLSAEYWMEHVERLIQQSLWWFDPVENEVTQLKALVERVQRQEEQFQRTNTTYTIVSREDIPILLFCDGCKYGSTK